VPALPPEAQRRLRELLPAEASLGNPVDMIASASAGDYGRVIDVVAEHGDVDAVVVIFVPPLVTRAEDVAAAIREAVSRLEGRLPVLTVFLSARGVPPELQAEGLRIPSYAFPEGAAAALARAAEYGRWRAAPEGRVPEFPDVRTRDAARVIDAALDRGEGWLAPDEVVALLEAHGLPVAEWRFVVTPEEAGQAAADLDGPVAVKAVAPSLVHKTEAGAVQLGLAGSAVVQRAAEDMSRSLRGAGYAPEGFVVQRMVPAGAEMLVGVVHDPLFGPVIACGAGGTAVELLKDVSVRITPLTDREAAEMIRSLRTFPLLDGFRGAPKADVPALENLLLRVGAMVEAHPEIAEMDLNPVMVLPVGARIVDARIRVEHAQPALPIASRRRHS
jgi:acetate---CoA ligase (ADP-forming)